MTENSASEESPTPNPAESGEESNDKKKPASETGTTGRGRGRGRGGGRGGRGRGRSRNRNGKFSTAAPRTLPRFKGNTDAMKGHVFQCHSEEKDKKQFLRTVGVLGEYANKMFDYPEDIASVHREFKLQDISQPKTISKKEYEEDFAKKFMFEADMKAYMRRRQELKKNLQALYAVVWGQCSPMMQSKLESKEDYKEQSVKCNCVWLLKEIRAITHQFEETTIGYDSLFEAWKAFYGYKQSPEQTLHEYLKDYQALIQVLEHYNAPVGEGEVYEQLELKRLKAAEPTEDEATLKKRCKAAGKLRFVAISFLRCADRKRYGGLWNELRNNFARGLDQYPLDIIAAYNLLLNYAAPTTQNPPRRPPKPEEQEEVSAVSFLQKSDAVPGSDGVTRPKIQCYNCQQQGHYADMCPTAEDDENVKEGVQCLQVGPEDEQTDADSERQESSSESEEDTESSESEGENDGEYRSEFSFLMNGGRGVSLQQSGSQYIPDSWILLDSQSTVSVFKNRSYLYNIKKSKKVLKVHTNGGTQISNQIGKVKNFGYVWFNPNSLANILSMAEVRKVCRITMDTSVEAAMIVHRKDGSTMKFKEFETGLYYFDVADKSSTSKHSRTEEEGYLFLSTVEGNKRRYTRRDVEAADKARVLFRRLGYNGEQQFQTILQENMIRNCPVTAHDAKRAINIYGPDVFALKGRTVKRQNEGIPNREHIETPEPILQQYGVLRMFVDIFWVNGSAYLHTITEHVKFRTVAPIKNRKRRTLLMEIKAVMRLYESRGFRICRVEADQEFECIMNDLLPTEVNIADTDDHVHEAERSIRVVKERTRCVVQRVPFNRMPKLMMRAAIEGANKSLNQFPVRDGISDRMSPLTIVTGRPMPDYHDLKLDFGAYAQVFEENKPTNTTKNRTTGAIALNPVGNAQGGYHFMSLATGKRLARQQWTELPMPDGVIERVQDMAEAEDQPLLQNREAVFEWEPGYPVFNEDEDEQDNVDHMGNEDMYWIPDEAPESFSESEDNGSEDDSYDETDGSDTEADEAIDEGDIYNEEMYDDEDDASSNHEEHDDEVTDDEEENRVIMEEETANDGEEASQGSMEEEKVDDKVRSANAAAEDTGNETPRYGLRANRRRSYGHRLDHQMDEPENDRSYGAQYLQRGETKERKEVKGRKPKKISPKVKQKRGTRKQTSKTQERGGWTLVKKRERNTSAKRKKKERIRARNMGGTTETRKKETTDRLMKEIVGFVMTQMSARAGIKKHGQVAIDALFQEFLQLHKQEVFEGKFASALTKAQKKAALRAISVIKEKRNGKVKGRTVADGSTQRDLYDKIETSSPTVSTDALIISLMIDALEGRDVGVADVTGAYLNAVMDDFTLLKLEGAAVKIMCDVSEDYRKYVTKEKGKKVLYLQLKKALYGCVKSALLWYELLAGTLKDMGFEINPYDNCVANKEINGSQCTIAWYVDDTKISHKDPAVVSQVIENIEGHFGKMSVTRGKEHVFLGMNITMNEDGTATIDMSDYVREAIEESGEEINKSVSTPATRDLLEVDDESPRLDKEKAEKFHSVVAKLLYVSKRARLDIQLPVAILCTRVSCCTEQDWKKLVRILQYLYGTIEDKRIVGADEIEKMGTWVDASYAVHWDMKSHTGAVISFGTGAAMSRSAKQKLNTKSSTEAELVGASDYLTYAIWAKKFIEAQGYKLKENKYYQDNESAIRFEKNGRKSCGPNSRHIDIRYFFTKDRLEKENFLVEHCPTERMIADFFTKPLQGSLFKRLREVIMGRAHVKSLLDPATSAPKERVGKDKDKMVREDDARTQSVSTGEPQESRRSYAEAAGVKDGSGKRQAHN